MEFATPLPIVVIGAGITGLSAASGLMQAGQTPIIFDKGRGVGGRVATRRVTLPDGTQLQFDHGAQFATAKGAGFAAVLGALQTVGLAAQWHTGGDTGGDAGGGRSQIIGAPAMSSLARGIAQAAGLQIVQNAAVISVRQDGPLWCISFADGSSVQAERVILTVPAPQLAALLGPDHDAVRAAASVQMQPCLTLMAAARAPAPFTAARDNAQDLAWIAQDNSKSGRAGNGLTTWIAQTNLSFSLQHLEKSSDEMCALMLPLLCLRLGLAANDIVYSAAHRWRYARADIPLGVPFLHPAAGLYIGGDWCLGPRIEAACDSGAAISADILASG
jgi:predicted NAD/FAD-dependent oxidoreductase